MECPECMSKKTGVLESRPVEANVFRIRVCKDCGYKFYTEECEIDIEDARPYMAYVKQKYRESKKIKAFK